MIKQYIGMIVEATRQHHSIYLGSSPRGSLALYRGSQSRALLMRRDYVTPDDIKALAVPVLAHRLILPSTDGSKDRSGRASIQEILNTVPVPGTIVR